MNDEHDAPEQSTPGPEHSSDRAAFEGITAAAYVNYVVDLVRRPEEILVGPARGLKVYGLINIGAVALLLLLTTFLRGASLFSTVGWHFRNLVEGGRVALAFVVAVALVIFAFKWYSERQGNGQSLEFFIEKLGAALVAAGLLLLVSIPFSLFGATLHGWLYPVALTFVYIAVFMTSYWFVAAQRLQPAVLFVLGFSFVFWLIRLIL